MRVDPGLQPHRMPASHAGEKNAVSAVIPWQPVPLSEVFADTFFLASSLERSKVHSCIVCALTKFVHLEPAAFLQKKQAILTDGGGGGGGRVRQVH